MARNVHVFAAVLGVYDDLRETFRRIGRNRRTSLLAVATREEG